MNARTLALTFALIASAIAFGGVADTDMLTENAAAQCTYVEDVGCLEQYTCEPARTIIEKVTGRPTACTM